MSLAAGPALAAPRDGMKAVFSDIGAREPGCAVATVRHGRIDFSGGYGLADLKQGKPIDADTVFDAASLSKQFTAFAALWLEKKGQISRKDSVRKYVPELGPYAQKVTIGDLIHHTSGLRDAMSIALISERQGGHGLNLTDDEMIALLARQQGGETPPGSEQMYSNSGYRLLAIAIQRASGRSLQSILSEAVFEPLGMTSTAIGEPPASARDRAAISYRKTKTGFDPIAFTTPLWIGAGGVRTTAHDFALWMENFWTGRAGGKDLMAEMATVPALSNGEPSDYAAGLTAADYRGLARLEHGGSVDGFRHKMAVYPAQRFAAVVLCNRADAATTPRIDAVSDVYLGAAARTPKALTTEIQELRAPDNVAVAQAPTGFYRDRRYGEYLRILPGGVLSYRGETRKLQEAAPGVYRADELAAFPGFQIYIGFKADSLNMAYGGELDRFDHVPDWAPGDLSRFVGTYWSNEAQAHLKIELRDGVLVSQIAGRSVPLSPGRPGEFIYGRGAVDVPAEGPADQVTLQVFGLRGIRFDRSAAGAQ
ncbi:serine hydrolase domain-containing protein [Phenylobacterium aquaticum]|uniref:serine hydrolase domain-containing protein n=1 Tax=Phenylobacterium aquaticum TaxID=1763816 RepID=UPI001F5CB501|nr:serine hydrolase domain-containing protein [Phenylobacterium aquaticum]MCI3131188.1 beta-lactamase family protein [Phenylobacterium aquaticum]